MAENASLDEFDDDSSTAADPEPATATYGWSPDAPDCERCGEPAERRWRDDGSWACADCKEW